MKVFLTIIMMFIVIMGMMEAYAEEFTYNEKVEYAVESQKVIAHMIAIYDNFGKDGVYKELSNMHFDHILKQNLKVMEKYYSEQIDYQDELNHTLFTIQNSGFDEKAAFIEHAKKLFPLLNTGTDLITNDLNDDKFFRLVVMTLLLESVKTEYIESQEAAGIESLLKKQHADTMAIRAHMYFENTNEIPTEMKYVVEQKFQKIFQLMNNHEVKIEHYELLNEIVSKIYDHVEKNEQNESSKEFDEPEILNLELEITNLELDEPENIGPKIMLRTDHKNGNEIVSFEGTGFPRDIRVDIKYVTNLDKEIQHVKVRSLDNGTFYLPIEMNPEEKTYFLNAEYLETVTVFTISNNA
ncbi:hypothetical protein [Nitrosopumilus sp.]|uniref:hypothetical protein n=1 Tax=Nitrosopumilus sp. TaxID=2024843 RepID=UPI003D0BADB9